MNVPVAAPAWWAFRNLKALPQQTTGETVQAAPSESVAVNPFIATLKSRAVWTLAIFLMLYVGAEESM